MVLQPTTISALIRCTNFIFPNDFLGHTQFEFSKNLRTLFKMISQNWTFDQKMVGAQSIQSSNVAVY